MRDRVVGTDWNDNPIKIGDVVLVDFRGFSNEDPRSEGRSIGLVVDSKEELDIRTEEDFIKTKNPTTGNINYLGVSSWESSFEKIEKSISEDVLKKYF